MRGNRRGRRDMFDDESDLRMHHNSDHDTDTPHRENQDEDPDYDDGRSVHTQVDEHDDVPDDQVPGSWRSDHQEKPDPVPEPKAPVQTKVIETKTATPVISETELARNGFTSDVPWENLPADVVVVCCSDQRFGRQNRQFLRALGFKSPHFIQIPSGLAVFHSLVAATGFLSKGMNLLLDKAIDLTGVKDVICIAHHDCGGYKVGRFEIVGKVTRRLAGVDIRHVQVEHLHKAARDIQRRMGNDTNVRAFYSDVVGREGDQRVKFTEIDLAQRNMRANRRSA